MASPTSTTLCHTARGCAVPGATPGPGHIVFPTPQGVVPFVHVGGCCEQGRNGSGFVGGDEGSSRKDLQIYTQYHIPPVPSFGTTLSGLLLCWAWTQGSASAAQPWALWQNPFRIPGGGWGKARPSNSGRGNGDGPSSGVSGWGNWSTSIPTVMIPLGFPEGRWGKARPWGFPEGEPREMGSGPHFVCAGYNT